MDALNKLQQNGLSLGQATAQINQVVTQQAAMLSADDIFYVSSLICLGLIGLVWLAKPVKSGAAADAASSGAH
jgi:DHA2 family multidrug resistance protein